jgi:hypothetical protein
MPRYHIMPRIKVYTDNKIVRPSVMAEQYSRKIGTRKRVGYAMAKRFIGRIDEGGQSLCGNRGL